jgi:hypothetical protein
VAATPRPAPATPRPVRAPTPPAFERLGTMLGSMLPRRKRRKPGIVGLTMAMGMKAIEDFLPQRKKRPRRAWAWISAAAVGVSLAVGAIIFYRPVAAPPAAIKVERPAPRDATEPAKPTPTRRERRRH